MKKILYLLCCFIAIGLSSCFEGLETGLPDKIVFGKEGGEQKFVGHNLTQYSFNLYDKSNSVQYDENVNENNVRYISNPWVSISIVQDTLVVNAKKIDGGPNRRVSTINVHDYISVSSHHISIRQYNK